MPPVPTAISELGTTSQALRPNPRFDPRGAAWLTTRDYYVFSRIDGVTSVREVIAMVAFDPDETAEIVRNLWRAGAILKPDEPERDVGPAGSAGGDAGGGGAAGGAVAEAEPSDLSEEEERALAEDVGIEPAAKRRILAMRRVAARGDPREILDVSAEAGRREIKRAYFRLSKEYHPDSYYGIETGRFGPWLAEIFEAISAAYADLAASRRGGGRGDRGDRGRGGTAGRAGARE